VVAAGFAGVAQAQADYPFRDPRLGDDQRIADLLGRLTLEEKILLMSDHPKIPRLGIVFSGQVEGLHGLALGGPGNWQGRGASVVPTTTFPQARGLGQTWDPALLRQVAAVEGFEARWSAGRYHRGGLVIRAPNADLARDPRWGRNEESYGEDPFQTGTMAVAYVTGLEKGDPAVAESHPQGGISRYWLAAPLMKHFLANSNEDERNSSSSNFDERLFREYYSVPFRMGIELGHANAFMTAYNAWNGIPMAVHPVLKNVVMREWGFDGIISTDGRAFGRLVTTHHYYPNLAEAAAGAIHAGINHFLDDYRQPVSDALAQHLITEKDLDDNLRGVFRVMIHLGLWDPPNLVPYSGIGVTDVDPAKGDPWDWQEYKALARRATDESIVLLKNNGRMLPLDAAKMKSVAVIGPYADQVLLDWYSGTPPYEISPLEGIRRRAGDRVRVQFATGNDLVQAADLARRSDVAIVILGNHPTCNAEWAKCPLPSDGKETIDRKSLTLEQEEIAKAIYAANPRTIEVLNASFPYSTAWSQKTIPSIVEMTQGSEEEGEGLADVLFGDYNPAGRLTETWVASMDQLPPMMDYDIRHGRTYMYLRQKPLYPFGYGLSYTAFSYSRLALSSDALHAGGTVQVSFDVRNSGQREGDEVAQLYIAHLDSKVSRPIEELKGFERIHLQPGETRTVTFPLAAEALRYWDIADNKWVLDPDRVEIRIGSSAEDIRLKGTIRVAP
jgi:beta-glucosidase